MQNLNGLERQESDVILDDAHQNPQVVDMAQLMQNMPNPPPIQMEQDMIGAIKIKDALFIGDELASQDLEFVVNNKVTHIINWAGREIANHWEPIGVAYLTFYWLDVDNQVLFDQNDKITTEINNFIDEAHVKGESVLVHSVRGQSRASAVLAVYFMQKYKWTLFKTLEFLNSRRPDLEIRAAFINQLSEFERRLWSQGRGPESGDWNELSNKINIDEDNLIEWEELLLRNTFLNAQMGPIAIYKFDDPSFKKGDRLKWIDTVHKNNQLRTNNSDDDLIFKDEPEPIVCHKAKYQVKPIIKKSDNLDGVGVKVNFYQPEDKMQDEFVGEGFDTQATNEVLPKANTISDNPNYDPMLGNKTLGNTMPLPKNNNLLENNAKVDKLEDEAVWKNFIDKIKQGDGMLHKKPVRDKNKKAYNYIMGKIWQSDLHRKQEKGQKRFSETKTECKITRAW